MFIFEIDFMFDKDNDIEISSTKPLNNSSRPESQNIEDRYVIMQYETSIENRCTQSL